MHEVIVYSRPGCHLCDVVREQLTQLQREADFQWREVDIDTDPELLREYNEEVPVIYVDGRKCFRYRLDARRFLAALAASPASDRKRAP